MFKTSGGKYIAPQLIVKIQWNNLVLLNKYYDWWWSKNAGSFIQPSFDFIKEWAVIHMELTLEKK
jgi:long-chain acyl-CoA synthetase